MRVRGPNNVERAVQADPTMLRYASAITEQKKCWELLAQKFDRIQTLRNNSKKHATTYSNRQKGVQKDATCNIQQCWELLAENVASVFIGIKCGRYSEPPPTHRPLISPLFSRSRFSKAPAKTGKKRCSSPTIF